VEAARDRRRIVNNQVMAVLLSKARAVNALKDVQASILREALDDAEDVFEQLAEEKKLAESYGLDFEIQATEVVRKWACPNSDTACELRGNCVNPNCDRWQGGQ
jgi:hypothetical protein